MALFEQGVFNFAKYGVGEYVLVGLALITFISLTVISIVLYKTAKDYSNRRSDRKQMQQELLVQRAPPPQPEQQAKRPPKKLPPTPKRASEEYGEMPWTTPSFSPRPLPRVPRESNVPQPYTALPVPPKPQPSTSHRAIMGRLPPAPQRREQYQPLAPSHLRSRAQRQRQYQPFAQ